LRIGELVWVGNDFIEVLFIVRRRIRVMVCSHEGTYSTSNMYVYVSLLIKRTLRWLSETQITLDML